MKGSNMMNINGKNYNTIKNQRATVADNFTDRNKNSLLGISKSGGAANVNSYNQSTLD
jgi:hypothetical protein